MKIFVLHYSKLTDRKQNILTQFEKHNITDYEFIELFDKDALSQYTYLFDHHYRMNMLSLFLKHLWVYKEIENKYDYALILEDDVILSDNFVETLNKYMTELPADYDMLFIGDGCNLHIKDITNTKCIYEKSLYPNIWEGDGAARCSDSYIVNKKCAVKLNEYITKSSTKIKVGIDWWINIAARDNNLKVYWSEPTIVTQGSQNGMFKREI
jgi:GR25 family glycosyltransferase involved in LPS biosynthesis